MIQSLLHEDFYKSGSLVDEDAGIAVGWVTHPGSFSDCMPVWNKLGTFFLSSLVRITRNVQRLIDFGPEVTNLTLKMPVIWFTFTRNWASSSSNGSTAGLAD